MKSHSERISASSLCTYRQMDHDALQLYMDVHLIMYTKDINFMIVEESKIISSLLLHDSNLLMYSPFPLTGAVQALL